MRQPWSVRKSRAATHAADTHCSFRRGLCAVFRCVRSETPERGESCDYQDAEHDNFDPELQPLRAERSWMPETVGGPNQREECEQTDCMHRNAGEDGSSEERERA